MFNFGQNTTTAGSTFGTTTQSTGSLFGGGDASKGFPAGSTTTGQDNKQNVFGSSTFGSFMFGSKTTTAASSNLFSPATTSSGTTFGASKPLNFDFSSPPNQTVGSPGFGTISQQPQQAPQNLSFGAPTQQQQLQQQQPQAPAFGTPAQTTASALPFSSPPFSFNKPATTGAFSFTTPTSGFSAPQQPIATTATAPQTTQSFFSVATTSTTNLGSTPASTALGIGQSSFGGGFNFGGTSSLASGVTSTAAPILSTTTTTASSLSFPAPTQSMTTTPASAGFGYGQPSLSFAPVTQSQQITSTANQSLGINLSTSSTPSSGFNFAPKATLSFATTSSQPTISMGSSGPILSMGTTAPTLGMGSTAPTLGIGTTAPALGMGTTAPTLGMGTSAPALSMGSTTSTLGSGTTAPTLSLGTSVSSLSTGTTTTAQPTLSLGTTSTLSTGLSFSKPTSTTATSLATTSASTGITFGKTATTTTMASLTTTTTTTAVAPPPAITSITFAQLEENINKWTQELEEQEKTFINQATQLNAWDRLLIANGEKIVELNDAVQTVKNEQQSLEHELGFVLAQQKELEELLAPLEKQLLEDPGDRLRDPEREHMYGLAETLETQLRQMSEDLKEVIEHLNETNRSQDSNDPIVQIGRILNAHMSSMQWIDNSIAQISTKLDQLKATHDTLRRDNERSFQKTYN